MHSREQLITAYKTYPYHKTCTAEPILKDNPSGHKYVVCHHRPQVVSVVSVTTDHSWFVVTGSNTLTCCQENVVFQDR